MMIIACSILKNIYWAKTESVLVLQI